MIAGPAHPKVLVTVSGPRPIIRALHRPRMFNRPRSRSSQPQQLQVDDARMIVSGRVISGARRREASLVSESQSASLAAIVSGGICTCSLHVHYFREYYIYCPHSHWLAIWQQSLLGVLGGLAGPIARTILHKSLQCRSVIVYAAGRTADGHPTLNGRGTLAAGGGVTPSRRPATPPLN